MYAFVFLTSELTFQVVVQLLVGIRAQALLQGAVAMIALILAVVLIVALLVVINVVIGIFISVTVLSSILLVLSWIELIKYLTYRDENILWCFLYVLLIMFSTITLNYCWNIYQLYQLIIN